MFNNFENDSAAKSALLETKKIGRKRRCSRPPSSTMGLKRSHKHEKVSLGRASSQEVAQGRVNAESPAKHQFVSRLHDKSLTVK